MRVSELTHSHAEEMGARQAAIEKKLAGLLDRHANDTKTTCDQAHRSLVADVDARIQVDGRESAGGFHASE